MFGHAPMILPAVLGRRIVFRPVFWAHLVLLHATLAVRVVGDLVGAPALRAAGGAGNVAAVALFGIVTAWSLRGAASGPTRAGRFFGSLRTRR